LAKWFFMAVPLLIYGIGLIAQNWTDTYKSTAESRQ